MTVIAGILESTIGPQSHLPTLGDWVRFDGQTHNQFTPRSSDLMTGHFRAFAHATGSPLWLQVVAATQTVITSIQANHSPNTGLLPDFIIDANTSPKPAPPNFLEAATDGDYNYNAGRDPWRIGTDAVLSGDAVSLAQVRKITRWVRRVRGSAAHPIRLSPRWNAPAAGRLLLDLLRRAICGRGHERSGATAVAQRSLRCGLPAARGLLRRQRRTPLAHDAHRQHVVSGDTVRVTPPRRRSMIDHPSRSNVT